MVFFFRRQLHLMWVNNFSKVLFISLRKVFIMSRTWLPVPLIKKNGTLCILIIILQLIIYQNKSDFKQLMTDVNGALVFQWLFFIPIPVIISKLFYFFLLLIKNKSCWLGLIILNIIVNNISNSPLSTAGHVMSTWQRPRGGDLLIDTYIK